MHVCFTFLHFKIPLNVNTPTKILHHFTTKRKCATNFVCSCFSMKLPRLKLFKSKSAMHTKHIHTYKAIKSSCLSCQLISMCNACIVGWSCCSTLTSLQFSFQQHKMPTGGNDAILLENFFFASFESAHLKLKMLKRLHCDAE